MFHVSLIAATLGMLIPTLLLVLLLRFEESRERGLWMTRIGLGIATVCLIYCAVPYDLIADATPGTGLLDDSVAAGNGLWALYHALCGWLEQRRYRKDNTPPTADSTTTPATEGVLA